MSTKRVVVVFGATGNQGGSVVNTFLKNAALSQRFVIRGVTRDVEKPAAVALAGKGVTMVKADMDDKDSLRDVLKDAYATFVVTNWQEYMSVDREIQHGKNITDVAKVTTYLTIYINNEVGVQHLIWSTLPYVSKITEGKLTKVAHSDSKGIVKEYIQSLGIPSTFLSLSIFTSFVFFMIQPTAPDTQSYKISVPVPGTRVFPLLSANEDVGKYVWAIFQNREKYLGEEICGAEREYSLDEMVKILREDGGLDIVLEQCSTEEYKARLAAMGLPGFFQDDMVETMQYVTEYGYFPKGKIEVGHEILSEPLETFQQWVKKNEMIALMK
ncbi:hypothetical protein F5884DRAFT_685069 [Xylogone sp. PMI_703]|nr:hypothetical protein F5884DRAFT_685069 [Xylogone sp. PMI_703]